MHFYHKCYNALGWKCIPEFQGSINKSPSAPDLVRSSSHEKSSPTLVLRSQEKPSPKSSRQTFASAALLNPGLLHRHALSVDETAATYRYVFLQKNNFKQRWLSIASAYADLKVLCSIKLANICNTTEPIHLKITICRLPSVINSNNESTHLPFGTHHENEKPPGVYKQSGVRYSDHFRRTHWSVSAIKW